MSVIDLGSDHVLTFHSWSPDRALNPQFDGIPDVGRFGASIEHPNARTGARCVGGLTFDGPVQRQLNMPNRALWTVESWDPLTISPSVLCHCGDHGFIREGRWVAA